MFLNNGAPADSDQAGDGNQYAYGDNMVERIMAAEYNLAVQRNDGPQAMGTLARMLGQFLANRFSR